MPEQSPEPIRQFTFLRRRDGLSRDDFLRACAAYFAGRALPDPTVAAVAQSLHRNEIQPQVPGLMPEPIWDVLDETLLRPGSAEAPGDRLDTFPDHIDPDRIVQFRARQRVVLDGPARGIRILSLPRRRAGLSPDDFSRHYFEVHGALVARNEAFTTHCNRYVQHHVLPGTVRVTGGFVPYDGISEFWFDSVDKARAAWEAPSYMAELRADEKNFVGSPPSHRVLAVPVAVQAG
ncbi:EthD domain-containing protein [Pseudochelatococcus sp. B33]